MYLLFIFFVFFMFISMVISFQSKRIIKTLIACLLCAVSVVLYTWKDDMDFRENILSKHENENSDILKESKGTIKKIGDSFDVHLLSKYKDEYTIVYKDENGEIQSLSLEPYKEHFYINTKEPNIRVVFDEKRTKSTLVREENKFILREPKLFGEPVKEYYPMYTVYVSTSWLENYKLNGMKSLSFTTEN